MRKGTISGPRVLSFLAACGLSMSGLAAGEANAWNRFRGPNGSGVIRVSELPTVFGPDQNLIWKTTLPPGHSSGLSHFFSEAERISLSFRATMCPLA